MTITFHSSLFVFFLLGDCFLGRNGADTVSAFSFWPTYTTHHRHYPSTVLYYKVLGAPEPGGNKPSVLEEGTNKVQAGNLDGSFRKRMEEKYLGGQSSSPSPQPQPTMVGTNTAASGTIHTELMRHWGNSLELDTQPLEPLSGTVWKASSVLADYMTHPDAGLQWQDMSVIELGSGVGLCALVAALSGAYVVATDGADTALQLIQYNGAKYQEYCAYPLRAESLVWGDMQRAYEICQGQYPTFVLASDVVFQGSNLETLKATLQALCGPETWILLAHTWRADSGDMDLAFFDSFLDEFERYEADPSLMPPGYQTIQANGRPPVSIFMYRRMQ